MEPMVSICCAAYNHAPYIAQTLESFLAQEAPFSIEILVHDDASTDGTQRSCASTRAGTPTWSSLCLKPKTSIPKAWPSTPRSTIPARGASTSPCARGRPVERPAQAAPPGGLHGGAPGLHLLLHQRPDPRRGRPRTGPALPPLQREGRPRYFAADHVYTLGDFCALNFVPTATFLFPRSALDRLPPSFWNRPCPHGDLKLRMYLTAADTPPTCTPSPACTAKTCAPGP